jgi:DNA-binding transcriptional regulator YdaS (Cro superfamily)
MMASPMNHKIGKKLAIEAAGGVRALGRKIGLSHSAILFWPKIPAERVVQIERVTGVPREKLRPDLYVRD